MLIKIYESVINEGDTRTSGRIVGEIKCTGDGTPGEINFFDTCNEIWDVRDPSYDSFTDKRIIFEDMDKEMFKDLFLETLFVTAGGGEVDGVEYSIPGMLKPWYRETIEYIVQYKIPAWFGTICAEIAED